MPVLVIALASLLAAGPSRLESLEPLPRECNKPNENPVCIKWVLLHGGLTDRLLLLRDIKDRPAKETNANVQELEALSSHWLPEFRTMSQQLLRRAGRVNPNWAKPVCPKRRDLMDWTRVPSFTRPKFPKACGDVTPGQAHEAVFTPDERTCIYSTNRGEWGSSLTVRVNGKTAWMMNDPLFHPAEVVRAKSGFWIIESLRHMSGSGAVSFLSKDTSGKWRLRRIEEFPAFVEAWRLEGSALEIAVGSSDLPENPCKRVEGAVWVLSFSEGDRPRPELKN